MTDADTIRGLQAAVQAAQQMLANANAQIIELVAKNAAAPQPEAPEPPKPVRQRLSKADQAPGLTD